MHLLENLLRLLDVLEHLRQDDNVEVSFRKVSLGETAVDHVKAELPCVVDCWLRYLDADTRPTRSCARFHGGGTSKPDVEEPVRLPVRTEPTDRSVKGHPDKLGIPEVVARIVGLVHIRGMV
jgi:hypothetical protein